MENSCLIADDAELAAQLAAAAGRILLATRDCRLVQGKALGKAGDAAANAFLMEALAQQRPDDGILSEESKDTPLRLTKDRVWIIDPVDGTREYGQERADWAVHIGLSIGGKPVLGAVALPGPGLVFRSDKPQPVPPRRRPCACWSAARARRPRLWRSRKLWAPIWWPWARPGPRPWPWCAARRTSTSIPAVSTSGTIAPRCRGAGAWAACFADGWFGAGVQHAQPVAARPADLPQGACGAGFAGSSGAG
jgi:hypothetical protein